MSRYYRVEMTTKAGELPYVLLRTEDRRRAMDLVLDVAEQNTKTVVLHVWQYDGEAELIMRQEGVRS